MYCHRERQAPFTQCGRCMDLGQSHLQVRGCAKLVALCEHLRDNMVTEPDAEGSVMPVPEKFADSDMHRRILEIVALERREYVVGS